MIPEVSLKTTITPHVTPIPFATLLGDVPQAVILGKQSFQDYLTENWTVPVTPRQLEKYV